MNDRTTQLRLANNYTIEFKEQEISVSFFYEACFWSYLHASLLFHQVPTSTSAYRHRQMGKITWCFVSIWIKTEKANFSTYFIDHQVTPLGTIISLVFLTQVDMGQSTNKRTICSVSVYQMFSPELHSFSQFQIYRINHRHHVTWQNLRNDQEKRN